MVSWCHNIASLHHVALLQVSMSTSSIKLTGSFSSISMLNENMRKNDSKGRLGGASAGELVTCLGVKEARV